MKRPPRTLVNWLRAPSDISTERTRAWSPPTRACDTLRGGGDPACATPAGGAPIPAVGGPGALPAGRIFPLLRFLPLRLTDASLPPLRRFDGRSQGVGEHVRECIGVMHDRGRAAGAAGFRRRRRPARLGGEGLGQAGGVGSWW